MSRCVVRFTRDLLHRACCALPRPVCCVAPAGSGVSTAVAVWAARFYSAYCMGTHGFNTVGPVDVSNLRSMPGSGVATPIHSDAPTPVAAPVKLAPSLSPEDFVEVCTAVCGVGVGVVAMAMVMVVVCTYLCACVRACVRACACLCVLVCVLVRARACLCVLVGG
jgi:hypothetical protein